MSGFLTLKEYEKDIKRKKGGRNLSSEIVSKVLLDNNEEPWDPTRDLTREEYMEEQRRKKGINVNAKPFRVKAKKSRKKSIKIKKKSRKIKKKSIRKKIRV